jgi:hypothetical protein
MIKASALGAAVGGGVAATIAAACSPAVTAAEITALADLLTILGRRPDLLQPALQLSAGFNGGAKLQINVG